MQTKEGTVPAPRPASASPPLLSTKLSVPAPRTGLVPRPRLTSRLEPGRAHRLAVVIAPAGWGKSSLVCEWCLQYQDRSHAIAWVSLDSGDNDPNRFLLYLAAACDKAYPGLGETTLALLQSPQPPPAEVALTLLLNQITNHPGALTLILDDYHVIEALPVHEALTFLLEHLPPTLRLIIATRVDPPLPLSRLRVRGQLVEIRASDLRFTQEEALQFFNAVMKMHLEAEDVARLEARTEGWIAGMQLAAISMQGRTNPAEFLDSFTGSNRYIVDYLFDEVLARQSESLQTFLTETSLLQRLSGPLCEAVTQQTGGQALLEKLEGDNLFLIPLDEERRWYRYHHLFADVLQGRLEQQGKERVAELHRRAALWFGARDMAEEAIHHALAGKHLDLAMEYIEAYSSLIWVRGGQRTVEQWIKAFPPDWIQSRPVLTVIRASVHLYDLQLPEALATLDNCRFKPKEDDPWEQDVWGRMAAIRSNVLRIQGDFASALTQVREALKCLSEDNHLWRGIAQFNLGTLLYEEDQPEEAKQPIAEAIEESLTLNNPHSHLSASIAYGQVYEAQGALQEAIQIYRTALDFATERKFYSGETAFIYAGLGRCSYLLNDLTAAEAYQNEGLERKHPAYSIACYIELARVKHARGDAAGLADVMPRMDAILQYMNLPWLASAVTALKILLKTLDSEAAAAWIQAYEARPPGERAQRVPMHGMREVEAMAWARLRLDEGAVGPVRVRLESLLETLSAQGLHGSALDIRAMLATLYQQGGQMDRAVAVLTPALKLAAQEGHIRVFLDAGRPLVPVMKQAAAQGVENQTVARLLDLFHSEGILQEKPKAEVASLLAEPLSERELEVLRLVAAGLSNPEIAEHLFLSVGTVKRHVYNIYIKLEVTGRVEAVSRARELHLLG